MDNIGRSCGIVDLREKLATGNVRTAILCHVLNNAAALLGNAFSDAYDPSASPWWLNILAAGAFGLGARTLRRRLHHDRHKLQQDSRVVET